MNLITQPTAWSCLPTAFAMALGVTLREVLAHVGHDGGEVTWPDRPEPTRRRSFHIQEMVRFAHSRRVAVVPVEALPVLTPGDGSRELELELDFEGMLRNCRRGVITGESPFGLRHAVAWDGRRVHDPNGTVYEVEAFVIETLWMLEVIR